MVVICIIVSKKLACICYIIYHKNNLIPQLIRDVLINQRSLGMMSAHLAVWQLEVIHCNVCWQLCTVVNRATVYFTFVFQKILWSKVWRCYILVFWIMFSFRLSSKYAEKPPLWFFFAKEETEIDFAILYNTLKRFDPTLVRKTVIAC